MALGGSQTPIDQLGGFFKNMGGGGFWGVFRPFFGNVGGGGSSIFDHFLRKIEVFWRKIFKTPIFRRNISVKDSRF